MKPDKVSSDGFGQAIGSLFNFSIGQLHRCCLRVQETQRQVHTMFTKYVCAYADAKMVLFVKP